jgi:murein DD-endopeptidase MepM/ murein hydrolase activator NlpD
MSPTPQPTPILPPVPPVTSSSTLLLWPLAGGDGRDWVINNYVDLDATSGTLDYTGASGSGAKTLDGHSGIDIDVPNFRWMDGGISTVLAAASGVVTSVHDNEPDRNTSCTGNANLVQVRHADGLTAVYGHLRKGSAAVSVGQQVSVGAALGVVGSSGCSTAPHLHFELRDAANRVVDPFRNRLWAAPPTYNTTISLMDLVIAAGDMTLQQIKDPAPNVTSIPRGSLLGVGVSMAGGSAGDVIRGVITAPTGATFSDNPVTFTTAYRHSFWFWNSQLSPTPGVWTISFFVNGVLVRSETVMAL